MRGLKESGLVRPGGLAGLLPRLWRSSAFGGPADTATAVRMRSLIVLLVLPGVLLFGALTYPLFEPDEGRYAQIPREMHERGEWIVPTMQGVPYLDKPPLFYWLVRLSYATFGVSEASARLVPAVCVHLTILLVYLVGRRSVGERSAFLAALLLTVAPGYLGIARILVLDGLLTLCVTAATLCGFEAVRTGKLKLGWWLLSALASGLGFLAKGPVAEVLLFPPLVAFAYLTRSPVRVGFGRLALFIAVAVAVNLPWYVGMYVREPGFLKHFFWEHNVMRFVQPFDHLQPVWFYVPILLAGFLPGLPIGLGVLRSLLWGGGAPRSCAAGFWWLSGAWCLFFFSCSGSKLPTYILPAFPPLCLALGEALARSPWWTPLRTYAWLGSWVGFVAVLVFAFVPWYALERSPLKEPQRVRKYTSDPAVPVVTYPRPLNSVAFAEGRSDFSEVKIKDVNPFYVDCHFRPRTVVLFTTMNAFDGMKNGLPPSLRLVEHATFRRPKGSSVLDKLSGSSPWGLCDIAVVEPLVLQKR